MMIQAADGYIDNVLGPASDRYFGGGYRAVRHRMAQCEPAEACSHEYRGLAQVEYGDRWSVSSGAGREPHLSSIDALILPILLLEQVPRAESLGLRRAWARMVHLRAAATPWRALDRVPVTLSIRPVAEMVTVDAVSGGIRVALEIEGVDDKADTRVCAPSLYGEVFRDIHSRTALTLFDPEALIVEAQHHFLPAERKRPAVGLESGFLPAVTAIDYIALIGEMAQLLAYSAGRTLRVQVENLWMRSLRGRIPAPPSAIPCEIASRTRVGKHVMFERNGQQIHSVEIRSALSNGVEAGASLAFVNGQAGTHEPSHS